MNLDDYLKSPGALTVSQLRVAIGAKSNAQVWQWQHGHAGRRPSADNCAAIERATSGAVTVEELRPDLPWGRIKDKSWPNRSGRPYLEVAALPA